MTVDPPDTPNLRRARQLLQQYWGHSSFRAGQEHAIRSALSRRDGLTVMPTGGGKSICYQVPALLLPGLTVVVSPLISLMQDQVNDLEKRGIRAALINSTLSRDEVVRDLDAASRGEIKLLYIAPERFQNASFCRRLPSLNVSLLAVDEAHCISQWGHDFRPAYARLGEVRQLLRDVPITALTATATQEVREDIIRLLQLERASVLVHGLGRPNLMWKATEVSGKQSRLSAIERSLRNREGSSIVYTSTVRSATEIANHLKDQGFKVDVYHGQLQKSTRSRVQDAFMDGKLPIIVATNAFGMGIDKPDVRLVLHYNLPGNIESYYQEAGRAGRDGQAADCVLLFDSEWDRSTQEFFIEGNCPRLDVAKRVEAGLRFFSADGAERAVRDDELVHWVASDSEYGEHQVKAALGALKDAGLLYRSEGKPSFYLRFLESSDGIRQRAGESEIEFLRHLYRAGGRESVYQGAVTSWSSLPADWSREKAHGMLTGLSRNQFVVWRELEHATWWTGRGERIETAVDWRAHNLRRKHQHEKLQCMIEYATGRACRRNYILAYFGEEVSGSCGNCDRCRSTSKAQPSPKPFRAPKHPKPATRAQSPPAKKPAIRTQASKPRVQEHHFAGGVCVHCGKQESMAGRFGWPCR